MAWEARSVGFDFSKAEETVTQDHKASSRYIQGLNYSSGIETATDGDGIH